MREHAKSTNTDANTRTHVQILTRPPAQIKDAAAEVKRLREEAEAKKKAEVRSLLALLL